MNTRTVLRSLLVLPAVLTLTMGCGNSKTPNATRTNPGSQTAIASSTGPIPADHPGWWMNHIPAETPPLVSFVSDELFAFNDDKLLPKADEILRRALSLIGTGRGPVYELTAHADLVGCEGPGQVRICIDLTERRAAAARQWFIDRGVAAERLTIRGAGALAPRTLDPAQQSLNRRVELRIGATA